MVVFDKQGFTPLLPFTGIANYVYESQNVYLAEISSQDPHFCLQTDIETELNSVSIPITLMNELCLGVLQITGRFGVFDKKMNQVLYDTLKFVAAQLASLICQYKIQTKDEKILVSEDEINECIGHYINL